jgi:uncharacterized membrane protein YozB (DUF420 family)
MIMMMMALVITWMAIDFANDHVMVIMIMTLVMRVMVHVMAMIPRDITLGLVNELHAGDHQLVMIQLMMTTMMMMRRRRRRRAMTMIS